MKAAVIYNQGEEIIRNVANVQPTVTVIYFWHQTTGEQSTKIHSNTCDVTKAKRRCRSKYGYLIDLSAWKSHETGRFILISRWGKRRLLPELAGYSAKIDIVYIQNSQLATTIGKLSKDSRGEKGESHWSLPSIWVSISCTSLSVKTQDKAQGESETTWGKMRVCFSCWVSSCSSQVNNNSTFYIVSAQHSPLSRDHRQHSQIEIYHEKNDFLS